MKTLSILCFVTLLIKQSISVKISSVRQIIITNAITSSIISTVNREIINSSNLLSDVSNGHIDYKTDIIYSSILILMFFLQYNILYNKEDKFKNIELFSNTKTKINVILFLFIVLFIKYIPNAY